MKETKENIQLLLLAKNQVELRKVRDEVKSLKNKPKATKYVSDHDYWLNDWFYNFQFFLGQAFCIAILAYLFYVKYFL